MNRTKFNSMLHKLELQMRRAEVRGDSMLVAHYNELIADLMDMQNDIEHPAKINMIEGVKPH